MRRSVTRLAAGLTLGAALFAPHVVQIANAQPIEVAGDDLVIPMDESQMAEMRGKFVPVPSSARAVEAVIPTLVTGIMIPQVSQNISFVPTSAVMPAVSGQITSVDVSMSTAWQHASQTDIAGVTVNVNAQNQTANLNTWSNTVTPTGTTPTFAVPANVMSPLTSTSGIGQTLQVAGDGNVVRNHIDVGFAAPTTFTAPVVPTGYTSTTCASCLVNTAPSGIGVAIAGTGGSVAGQVLGSSGVLQSAVVNSSYNQIINSLQLSVHTAPTGGTVPQILPILRAANIFH